MTRPLDEKRVCLVCRTPVNVAPVVVTIRARYGNKLRTVDHRADACAAHWRTVSENSARVLSAEDLPGAPAVIVWGGAP